jgi:hypothetical protein
MQNRITNIALSWGRARCGRTGHCAAAGPRGESFLLIGVLYVGIESCASPVAVRARTTDVVRT